MSTTFDPKSLNDVGNVTKAIVAFSNSPEYRELDTYYRRKSNFEVLGIQRNEVRHSRFVAWLLNPSEAHGLRTFGLKKFLEVCVLARLESKQRVPSGVPAEALDEVIVGRARISDAVVRTEVAVDRRSRIDIHIDCTLALPQIGQKRLTILIENKIDSTEHDAQTIRYSEWLRQHSDQYDWSLLVYLTPVPTLRLQQFDEPDCECKEFLQINYQYLVDYLIEPALALTQSSQARDFISDYLRALSVPSVIIADEENRGDVFMAISEHERKLLTAFWVKHRPLILASFYAISIDPNQEEEVRDGVAKVLNSLGTKDYSRYTVVVDGEVRASNVRKTDVGREVARLLIETGISFDDFEKLRLDTSSGFSLLKQENEITDGEHKRNRYRIVGKSPIVFQGARYYVSGNWGDNNIPRFQQFLAQNFPQINLVKDGSESGSTIED